jgi:RimJ/RimL family protein N-acetyltransferase
MSGLCYFMTMIDLARSFDRDMHLPALLREMACANIDKGWREYLAQITDRLTNREFAGGFYNAVPVEGADPSEYNYRIVSGQDIAIVCSLRFKSLAADEPFIEIMLCDRHLDRETINQVGALVKAEYSRFKPDRIRYMSIDDTPLHAEDEEDHAVFVGDIGALQQQQKPERYEEIELRPATDLEFYPHLFRNYEEMFQERELTPESAASLQRSMDQGLLFEAFIKGQWAGMMSAHRMTERFYTGVFIVEEIIDEKFRGQGYAPAMQRKFIDLLERDAMVFGEILSWNQRSRRTAMRVGRKKCGTTFFHKIE